MHFTNRRILCHQWLTHR